MNAKKESLSKRFFFGVHCHDEGFQELLGIAPFSRRTAAEQLGDGTGTLGGLSAKEDEVRGHFPIHRTPPFFIVYSGEFLS